MTVSSSELGAASTTTEADVVVVGGSVAGSVTAALLARHGARVTVVERSADLDHYKQLCTHEIIALGVPVFERLGVMTQIRELAGPQGATNVRTRYGWVRPDIGGESALEGFNVRRSVLDPLLRSAAIDTDGVEYRSGTRATAVLRDQNGRPRGVQVTRGGVVEEIRARVVVGADGATSGIAELAGASSTTLPHNRFGYAAYFEGVPAPIDRHGSPHSRIWMMNPDMAYAFPTDGGLTLLCCAPLRTDERVAAFKADIDGQFAAMMSALPDPPDLRGARRVGQWRGLLKSQNLRRPAASPGLAFVGDAAQVTDFVWGTGCGFAAASAAWLADSIGPELARGASDEGVDRALRSYRRRHRRTLGLHYRLITSFSTGRPFSPIERLLFRGGVHDAKVARAVSIIGSRTVSPLNAVTPAVLARAIVAPALNRTTKKEFRSVQG